MRRKYAVTVTAATMLLLMISVPGIVRANGGKGAESFAAAKLALVADSNEIRELSRAAGATGLDRQIPEHLRGQHYRDWYRFADHPLLSRLFPGARFYLRLTTENQGTISTEGFVFLDILANGRFYRLSDYNRLLKLSGYELNDKNIVDLAKAFTIIALAEGRRSPLTFMSRRGADAIASLGFPEVTFLEGKTVRELDPWTRDSVSVVAKLKSPARYGPYRSTGSDIQTWLFFQDRYSRQAGQFGYVTADGNDIWLVGVAFVSKGRTDSVSTVQVVSGAGGVKVEFDTLGRAHYYLVTQTDGSPQNDSFVHFHLSGMHGHQDSTFVRVHPAVPGYATDIYVHVPIDTLTGEGDTTWHAASCGFTGIFKVSAGYADPANPGGTYSRLTPDTADKELTLEAIKQGGYAPPEHFEIHYCEQFFVGSPTSGVRFASWCSTAATQAWDLLTSSGFWPPTDTPDQCHQFYLGNGANWFHENPQWAAAAFHSGKVRAVAIGSTIMDAVHYYMSYQHWPYDSDTAALIQSVMLHEIFHQVQWDSASSKFGRPDWYWLIEGQARSIQSVFYPDQEFRRWRFYTCDANSFLTGSPTPDSRQPTSTALSGVTCLSSIFRAIRRKGWRSSRMSSARPSRFQPTRRSGERLHLIAHSLWRAALGLPLSLRRLIRLPWLAV